MIQQLLDRFKIGRIDTDRFRFCGREYIQDIDGTITINCRDNTRAIRPIDIHKSEKGTTPVSPTQRTALRSVIGSLAWVARATRPDLAYCVNALQQPVSKATVETLREANRVVNLALGDAERCLTYKARLPWGTGELAVVTFCDASFAGEAGHKSQRGRLHYLTSASVASDQSSTHHDMHLISFSSSTMKRVCRATLQCEAYSLQHAVEHGDRESVPQSLSSKESSPSHSTGRRSHAAACYIYSTLTVGHWLIILQQMSHDKWRTNGFL